MVILAPAIVPKNDAMDTSKNLDISIDKYGFFKEQDQNVSSVVSSKPGIFIVGCSQGPKNIQDSVSQASAAVGKILSST
jgi:heterodisulfide reductase subunit A